MSFNQLRQIFLAALSFTLIGCTSDSAENLYPTNDAEAKVYYNNTLKTIIDTKCISCHNYHLEGTNRYDSYEKTKSSIGQMLERINVASNISMPPDGSPQLTAEEKQNFQEFFEILTSGVEMEEQIKLTWTAYKFQSFEDRSGVNGTFDEITFTFNEDYDLPIDMLKDAEVSINTSSVNIDGPEGTKSFNLRTGFFAFFSPGITGTVISYTNEEAVINFDMNGKNQNITFTISMEDEKLTLNGEIADMNFFDWGTAYEELDKLCGEAHENKVWPDVTLQLEIPIKE